MYSDSYLSYIREELNTETRRHREEREYRRRERE